MNLPAQQRICRSHADCMFYSTFYFFSDFVGDFGCAAYNGNIGMAKESGANHIFCSAGSGGSHAAEAAGL